MAGTSSRKPVTIALISGFATIAVALIGPGADFPPGEADARPGPGEGARGAPEGMVSAPAGE